MSVTAVEGMTEERIAEKVARYLDHWEVLPNRGDVIHGIGSLNDATELRASDLRELVAALRRSLDRERQLREAVERVEALVKDGAVGHRSMCELIQRDADCTCGAESALFSAIRAALAGGDQK